MISSLRLTRRRLRWEAGAQGQAWRAFIGLREPVASQIRTASIAAAPEIHALDVSRQRLQFQRNGSPKLAHQPRRGRGFLRGRNFDQWETS